MVLQLGLPRDKNMASFVGVCYSFFLSFSFVFSAECVQCALRASETQQSHIQAHAPR